MRRLRLVLVLILLPGCASLSSPPGLLEQQSQADQAYAAANYEQASTLYRSLALALPTDAGVRYQLGNSLARQGDTSGAVASYREALVRDPQHAGAWHNLLQVQLREALFTAGEMHQVLNPQQPMADRALGLGERLLDVMQQPGQAGGQEP